MEYYRYFQQLAYFIISGKAVRATKYLAVDNVISAQRKLYGGKIYKRSNTVDIIFKAGKPNYKEREFIKLCKKSGEIFPIKKIQLKFLKNEK